MIGALKKDVEDKDQEIINLDSANQVNVTVDAEGVHEATYWGFGHPARLKVSRRTRMISLRGGPLVAEVLVVRLFLLSHILHTNFFLILENHQNVRLARSVSIPLNWEAAVLMALCCLWHFCRLCACCPGPFCGGLASHIFYSKH